jgi:hypothetical protein
MATCPRCKGHLTENHRCPRRPVFVAVEIALWALTGAFAGLLLVALFDLAGAAGSDAHARITNMDAFAASVGALVAVGVNRALRS